MTTGGVEGAGTEIVSCETVDELSSMLVCQLRMESDRYTSGFEPVVLSCRLLHSALRSASLRGKYCDVVVCLECSRSPDERLAVELMLRTAWLNLWTGGVILDIVIIVVVLRSRD
jgi:hypothetical protein